MQISGEGEENLEVRSTVGVLGSGLHVSSSMEILEEELAMLTQVVGMPIIMRTSIGTKVQVPVQDDIIVVLRVASTKVRQVRIAVA